MLQLNNNKDQLILLNQICTFFKPVVHKGKKIINLQFPSSQFHILINDNKAQVVEGLHILPDVGFKGEFEIFIDIIRGYIDPYSAYLKEDFKIDGDRTYFFSLENNFDFNPDLLSEKDSKPNKIKRGPFKLNRDFSFLVYSSTALFIWLGWIFDFENTVTFGVLFLVILYFSIYYFVTDKINSFEVYILLFLFVSFILFYFKSNHYMEYYYIYFIISMPFSFTASLVSQKRNIISFYNSNNINGKEVLNSEIVLNQRRVISILTMAWGVLMLFIYIDSSSKIILVNIEQILSAISILFGAIILLGIYTIHNMQALE